MAALRMEALGEYDGNVSHMLQSDVGWAAIHGSATILVGEGRAGGDAIQISGGANDVFFNAGLRLTMPSAHLTLWHHFYYRTPQLPESNDVAGLITAWTSAGISGTIFNVYVSPTGSLIVRNSGGTILGETANNVIVPGSDHAVCVFHDIDAATGAITIWVDQVQKLALTGLNLGSTGCSLATYARNIQSGGFPYSVKIGDWFINDDTGGENDGFMGDPRLIFLKARADYAPNQGWTPQRRYMFGTGTLDLPNNNSAVTAADASAMRVGAGDFTIEGHFRFKSLPTSSNKATFFGKWLETGDLRSWQLFYGGPSLNSNHLEVRVSTDGLAGTVTSPISVSWSPIVGRRYHIALQVESGFATLYIDGIRQNAPVAWPTPADNSSLFVLGGQQNTSAPTILADQSFIGYNDEFRFTRGVARYGSGFAVPTQEFGRNAIDDPDYSSVVWLSGYNNSVVDESTAPRTLTARNSAARYAPDDGPPNNYPVILHSRDDAYLEAPFLAAQGILTFTVNPSDGDTVGADGETYTFKTTLTPTAGEVLIGATEDDSINNLVAAMNSDAGSGTLYAAGTDPLTNASAANRGTGQLVVDANTLGASGNSIAVSSSNGSNPWSAATLTGGEDIPDPSEFVLDRLPAHTVSVLAAAIIHRSRKTDSGDANVQASFITADGSSENGADNPLTTSFVYYNSIIEVDPSTMGGLTPTSFINARIRVDRTA